jgi:hypothetical protein
MIDTAALLKDAEQRVGAEYVVDGIPLVVNYLCEQAEILVNAAMDSDVILALASYEAGRLQVLEQLKDASKTKLGAGYHEFSINSDGTSLKIQYDYDHRDVWSYKTPAETIDWLGQQTKTGSS